MRHTASSVMANWSPRSRTVVPPPTVARMRQCSREMTISSSTSSGVSSSHTSIEGTTSSMARQSSNMAPASSSSAETSAGSRSDSTLACRRSGTNPHGSAATRTPRRPARRHGERRRCCRRRSSLAGARPHPCCDRPPGEPPGLAGGRQQPEDVRKGKAVEIALQGHGTSKCRERTRFHRPVGPAFNESGKTAVSFRGRRGAAPRCSAASWPEGRQQPA